MNRIDQEAANERHQRTPSLEFLTATEGSSDPQTLYERSWHLSCLGRRDEAVASARQVLRHLPDDRLARIRVIVAEKQAAMRSSGQAAAEILALVEDERDEVALARVRRLAASLYLSETRKPTDPHSVHITELAAASTALLALVPDDPGGLSSLGSARHLLKDHMGALAAFDRLHETGMAPCPLLYGIEAVVANATRSQKARAKRSWRRQQELLGRRPQRWAQIAFLYGPLLLKASFMPLLASVLLHSYWLFAVGASMQYFVVVDLARRAIRPLRRLFVFIGIGQSLTGALILTNYGRLTSHL